MRAFLPFAGAIDGAQRFVRELAKNLKQIPLGPAAGPMADSAGARNKINADLSKPDRVEYGYVVDAFPGIREYRVQPENGGAMLECCSLLHSAGGALGVYDGTTLVAGTHVRFMRHNQVPHSGVIVGVQPAYHVDPRLVCCDVVSQGSNTGIHLETGYHQAFKLGGSQGDMPLNGGLTNYGGRSPWDSLEDGELNYSTETGLMLHMDPYMVFMRADELTGIWCFYWDGLTRIGGQHIQELTSVSTREIYDDEGESALYRGVAGYTWENRGMLLNPNDKLTTEYTDPKTTQTDKAYFARLEPKNNDQQAFHRFQTYEGYLGQHEKKVISAPNRDSGYTTNVYQYGDKYQNIGLHDQQLTMAGHMFVRNALGTTIAKRPIIPVPKRMKIVTDQTGDGHGNYKAASLYTDGAENLRDHKVQPTPTPASTPESVNPGEETIYAATAVLDLHAHMFNWEGLHPFYYHEKDYFVPEESAYQYVTTNQEIPHWQQLDSTSQWYLTPASQVTTTIDHRKKNKAKIYKNTSYLSLLDDGGVLIGGGCGEEIRLVGGDIFLSCPGDVFMEAGRNVIAWAGRDVCIRAWSSVDITTTTHDVRIKAEHNLQMLCANDTGPWGMFFENRSAGPAQYDFTQPGEPVKHAGIIIQALDTEICEYACSIYLRTCIPDTSAKFVGYPGRHAIRKPGDITLDCWGCCGDITTRSNNIKHWVCCAIAHSFATNADDHSNGVNLFTAQGETLCNDLYVDGNIVAYNDVVAAVNLVGNNVATVTGGTVGKLTTAATVSLANTWTAGHTFEATLRSWANTQWDIDFGAMWYAIGRPGNTNVIHSEWVTLRNDADYKAAAFTLYESRWAQMTRTSGSHSAPRKWVESDVATNIPQLYTDPFPGNQVLKQNYNTYKQHSFLLYDNDKQQAKDRATTSTSSVYESPVTLNAPNYMRLDGNYPIIGK